MHTCIHAYIHTYIHAQLAQLRAVNSGISPSKAVNYLGFLPQKSSLLFSKWRNFFSGRCRRSAFRAGYFLGSVSCGSATSGVTRRGQPPLPRRSRRGRRRRRRSGGAVRRRRRGADARGSCLVPFSEPQGADSGDDATAPAVPAAANHKELIQRYERDCLGHATQFTRGAGRSGFGGKQPNASNLLERRYKVRERCTCLPHVCTPLSCYGPLISLAPLPARASLLLPAAACRHGSGAHAAASAQ